MSVENLFFDDMSTIFRTILIGFMAYISLIIILRVGGKRTLSQMNAFDFIVTVALGSILSAIMMNPDSNIAQGVTAFLTLVGLQFILTSLVIRSKFVRNIVKSQPSLLFYKGNYMYDAMKKERLHETEIQQAVRSSGSCASLDDVLAVILESDGTFSVIGMDETKNNINLNKDLFNNVKYDDEHTPDRYAHK